MILEHRKFELFDRMAFEKAIVKPPMTMSAPMPDEACFYYVLSGGQKVIGQIESETLRKNEGVLLKCGKFLAQMFEADANGRIEAIAIHFYPEVLKKIYQTDLPTFLKEPDSQPPRAIMATVKNDTMIRKYIESLVFYFDNPELADQELLVLKLKELILLLSKTGYAPKVREILSHLFSPQTFEFQEIIAANLYTDATVDQLAVLANMSLSSFKRTFKKHFSTTPGSYLKNKKMEKAANLLTATDLSVSEVAFDCGFRNLAHFSKSFKEIFSVSPSQFRLNQMNNSLN